MLGDNYLNFDEEEEFSQLIPKCEEAYENGTLLSLNFSEEEYEFLINHFVDEMDDDIVYALTQMAYMQHPYSSDLILRYADVLIVNRELDKALEILNAQMAYDTINPDIYFLLSRAYIKKLDRESAIRFLEKALALSPENRYDMLITAAQDYIDIGEYEDALLLLKRAEHFWPDNPELINDIAFCHERMGNLKESMIYYNKYIDIDPFNDNVWFNIGTIYARESDIPKANEAFDYAEALNPNNSSVLFNKAILCINSGRYDDGIDIFNQFLALEPDNIFALSGIADAYLAKDKLDESSELFIKVLKIDPLNIDANTGLAFIKMVKHDSDGALFYLREVMDDDNTDFHFLVSELLKAYKRTRNEEFLVYYLCALYRIKESELFMIYLEILVTYDRVWLAKLFELIPDLKKDDTVTQHINFIRKN